MTTREQMAAELDEYLEEILANLQVFEDDNLDSYEEIEVIDEECSE